MTQDAPVSGRLHAAGEGVAVAVVPLSSSLPIPLGVTAPAGIALLTWAFAGLAADDPVGPRALLLLAARPVPGGMTVATHYRDMNVEFGDALPVRHLPPDDRALLVRAALSMGSSKVAAHLPGLIALFREPGVMPEFGADAPRLVVTGRSEWILDGTNVPDHLLLRRGEAWTLARVASAALDFGEAPRVTLGLDPLHGSADAARPEAAIGLHAHGFTPYRIGPAR